MTVLASQSQGVSLWKMTFELKLETWACASHVKSWGDISGRGKTWKAQKGKSIRNKRATEWDGSLRDPTGPLVLGSTGVWGFYFNENEILKGFN